MNYFLKFLITFGLITLISAQAPKCNYKDDDNGLYTCTLSSAGIVPEDVNLGIDGEMDKNKSEEDVKRVITSGKASEFALISIFTKFKNLTKLEFPLGVMENITGAFLFNCDYLELIRISDSIFKSIPANTFLKCKSLIEINLESNTIDLLSKETFVGLESLKTLKLNKNKLSSVQATVFYPLTNLEHLDLSSNTIKSFDSNTFVQNKQLTYLSIANNNIPELIRQYFEGLTMLSTLDATNAGVNATEKAMFEKLEGLKVAKFAQNHCIDKDFEDFTPEDVDEFNTCIKNFNGASPMIVTNVVLFITVLVKYL